MTFKLKLLLVALALSTSITAQTQAQTQTQVTKTPLPTANAESQGFTKEGLQRIDQFFKQEIANNRMPGAVVAVTKNGKLVIYEAYGYRNKAGNIPMTKDTIFALASMTKVMTTVSALTFYEEAKLPLNAPVGNWLPELKAMKVGHLAADGSLSVTPAKKPITIQDLMRHTNGLTYGGRGATAIHKLFPSSSSSSAMEMDGKQFIEKLSTAPLLYEPGTAWDYGFGLDVLGLVQEKIAKKTLAQIMQERLWSKLGMVDTGFNIATLDTKRFAQPLPTDTLTGEAQSMPILTTKIKYDCGGGCAFGTAGDYVRFGQMLLNGGSLDGKQILGPQTVAFMTANHLDAGIKNNVAVTEPARVGYGFGLGVAVRTERGLSAINGNIGDFSWNGAYGTTFWADPKEKMVVVVMAATPGEVRKEYREKINALIYGALAK
jgi:CubicO group peptidase (beta-lactamase class C family)